MERVRLAFAGEPEWVWLGEPTGRSELAVTGTGTAEALRLLDALLAAPAGGGATGGAAGGAVSGAPAAASLAAPDRDRLLAGVYVACYGPKVATTVDCGSCGEPFDLDFELPELVAALTPEEPPAELRLTDGRRFRLPTGEDECAVAGLDPERAARELARRCLAADAGAIPDVDEGGAAEALAGRLAEVAPLIDLELEGRCPECGAAQPVHFDLQHYLLAALAAERDRLLGEVHRLAAAYGWSLGEILDLPRRHRRTLVELIEADAAAGREVLS